MNIVNNVFVAAWLVVTGGVAVLCLFYPERFQGWYGRRVQRGFSRYVFPRFWIRFAESKWFRYYTRLFGLIPLAMFFLVLYLLFFRN